MLRPRKRPLATKLFAFDENGVKVELTAADFGAKAQERLGSQVRGLSLPQPTQFIRVPETFLSPDQVLEEMILEKRTLSWRLRLAMKMAQSILERIDRVVDRWLWRGRIAIGRAAEKLHERVRKMRMKDSWGFNDFTEIAEAPPEFRPRPRRTSAV
jgi:hypothetical protein